MGNHSSNPITKASAPFCSSAPSTVGRNSQYLANFPFQEIPCVQLTSKIPSMSMTMTPKEDYPRPAVYLRPASPSETLQALKFYLRNPVPNYELVSVEVVQNRKQQDQFRDRMNSLQKSIEEPPASSRLARDWSSCDPAGGPSSKARRSIFRQCEVLCASYLFPKFPAVKFLPVWYRPSSESELRTIVECGYQGRRNSCCSRGGSGSGNSFSFQHSRELRYRKGVKTACEACHAWQIQEDARESGKGEMSLLLNWAGMGFVYPMLNEDDINKGNKRFHSYDGLYIPVRPQSFNGYSAPSDTQPDVLTEVHVLEPVQCIPYFVLRLRPATLTPTALRVKEVKEGQAAPAPSLTYEISEEDTSSETVVSSTDEGENPNQRSSSEMGRGSRSQKGQQRKFRKVSFGKVTVFGGETEKSGSFEVEKTQGEKQNE